MSSDRSQNNSSVKGNTALLTHHFLAGYEGLRLPLSF